jgi:hypothetical protein
LPIVNRKEEKDEAKDGEQYERFLETAKRIGANDDEAFEKALGKILKAKPKPKSRADKKKEQ